MKFKVKVGVDFDPTQQMKVTVEVAAPENQEEKKSSPTMDWKVAAVWATLIAVLLFGGYDAFAGNTSPFDKILDAVIKVASANPKGITDGKEKLKDNSSSD